MMLLVKVQMKYKIEPINFVHILVLLCFLWLMPVDFIDPIHDYFLGGNMTISVSVKKPSQLLID